MKFDQDLCLNFGKKNLTLGSGVPLAMFSIIAIVCSTFLSGKADKNEDLKLSQSVQFA